MPRHDPAADNLTHAGKDDVREHADVVRVPAGQAGGRWIQRQELHPPAERADVEDRRAQRHGHYHIPPVASAQGGAEILPVHAPEGEVQQHHRHGDPERIAKDICDFLVHCCHKVNGKSPNNV